MKRTPKMSLLWPYALAVYGLFVLSALSVAADQPALIRLGVASVGVGGRSFVGGSALATVHERQLLEQEFKKDGIEIQWSFFKTAGPGVNEAYANGQLDFAWQGDLPQLIGKASGLKTRYLLSSTRRGYLYLAAGTNSKLHAVKDLRGRKVAIHKGTCLQLSIDRLLAANGLRERDLKVYNMDFLTAGAALANGQIDAALGTSNTFDLEEQGAARLIYSGAEDDGRFGCATGVTVTEAFAEKYPDITQRVVTTLVTGAYWTAQPENRQAVYEIWTKSGYPIRYFAREWDTQDFSRKFSPLLDDFLINSYRVSFDDAKKLGLLRGQIDFNQWFDSRYLQRALTELQLTHYWHAEGAQPAILP